MGSKANHLLPLNPLALVASIFNSLIVDAPSNRRMARTDRPHLKLVFDGSSRPLRDFSSWLILSWVGSIGSPGVSGGRCEASPTDRRTLLEAQVA